MAPLRRSIQVQILKRISLRSLSSFEGVVNVGQVSRNFSLMWTHFFVFVGKKELSKIPLFGFFYKRTCILVDRNDPNSRKEVYHEAQKRLKNGLSICIFPEGLVPEDESIILAPFKDGAFSLSIEHKIPIVPICFHDNKKRLSYTFFSGSFGNLRSTILPFVETKNLKITQRKELKNKVFDLVYNELVSGN